MILSSYLVAFLGAGVAVSLPLGAHDSRGGNNQRRIAVSFGNALQALRLPATVPYTTAIWQGYQRGKASIKSVIVAPTNRRQALNGKPKPRAISLGKPTSHTNQRESRLARRAEPGTPATPPGGIDEQERQRLIDFGILVGKLTAHCVNEKVLRRYRSGGQITEQNLAEWEAECLPEAQAVALEVEQSGQKERIQAALNKAIESLYGSPPPASSSTNEFSEQAPSKDTTGTSFSNGLSGLPSAVMNSASQYFGFSNNGNREKTPIVPGFGQGSPVFRGKLGP